jgi:flagellar brake protein
MGILSLFKLGNTKQQPTQKKGEERYTLREPAAIARALQELAKRPEIITAWFNNDSESIMTTVIDVMGDRNLVVFEPGDDEESNQRLLQSNRMVCLTSQEGIKVRFIVENLRAARLKGQMVIAADMPNIVFRIQRRDFFRVHTQGRHPVTCSLVTMAGQMRRYAVADVSCGGIGIAIDRLFDYSVGDTISDCTLIIPNEGKIIVDLVVRNILTRGGRRAGCSFKELSMKQSAILQRFIHRLQVEQNTSDY